MEHRLCSVIEGLMCSIRKGSKNREAMDAATHTVHVIHCLCINQLSLLMLPFILCVC